MTGIPSSSSLTYHQRGQFQSPLFNQPISTNGKTTSLLECQKRMQDFWQNQIEPDRITGFSLNISPHMRPPSVPVISFFHGADPCPATNPQCRAPTHSAHLQGSYCHSRCLRGVSTWKWCRHVDTQSVPMFSLLVWLVLYLPI